MRRRCVRQLEAFVTAMYTQGLEVRAAFQLWPRGLLVDPCSERVESQHAGLGGLLARAFYEMHVRAATCIISDNYVLYSLKFRQLLPSCSWS